jgi:hypothetical protein
MRMGRPCGSGLIRIFGKIFPKNNAAKFGQKRPNAQMQSDGISVNIPCREGIVVWQ